MADVYSQRSPQGDVTAMLRREDRPAGAQALEIDDGGPNTAQLVLSREDALALGEALVAAALAADPANAAEASAWGRHIHLHPEVVNRRISAAIQSGC